MKKPNSKKHADPGKLAKPLEKNNPLTVKKQMRFSENAYEFTKHELTDKEIQAIENNPEFKQMMAHAREMIQKINKHRVLNGLPPFGKKI